MEDIDIGDYMGQINAVIFSKRKTNILKNIKYYVNIDDDYLEIVINKY